MARDEARKARKEAEKVEERAELRTPVIYEIVRRRGDEEMERPAISLWWSGIAAGLSISFSLLAQGILTLHLPQAGWTHLLTSAGYTVGFLMVVLGRQQLFTETTITAVLPVMAEPSVPNILRMLRMWGIVFAANTAGTLFAALFCTFTPVIPEELRSAMLTVSAELTRHDWPEMALGGVSSGFLIATMVWLLPSAETARFWVVVAITWLIAAGGFPHIVAGSVESFMLVASGELGIGTMLGGFMLPVLAGNIVGGTALFALLSYAQVMKELH